VAAESVGPELRAGRLYLGVDWRNFTEYAGHYLLEGSELLQGIAAELPAYPRCQEILRQRGIPTIVECNIPLEWLTDGGLRSLVVDVVQYLRFGETETDILDHSITLNHDLPPKYVVGHFHPRSVKDPHAGFIAVELMLGQCGWCARQGRLIRDYSRINGYADRRRGTRQPNTR
jgi:hypothetical protein